MNKKEILLARHFATLAMVYAVIAMALGVFYREFTKFSGFAGRTSLSFLHTHYFALGMVFFLIQMLLEKTFAFSSRNSGKFLLVYQLGLNITGLGFFLRGMSQVLGNELSRGMDASISGISGIGHILLGIGMLSLLLQVRRAADGTGAGQNQDGADVPQRAFSSLAAGSLLTREMGSTMMEEEHGRRDYMPNNGNNFRHALAEYIRGWGEGLAVEEEKYIGWRFISTPRKLDIVIMNPQNALHGHRGQAPGDQRFGFREAELRPGRLYGGPHPVRYCLFGALYPGRHEGQADFLRSWY